MNTKIYFWISILILSAQLANAQTYTRTITVEFDTPPSASMVNVAKLKYDKEFAYSLTIDDGRIDAINNAYNLLNGLEVPGTDMIYGNNYGSGVGNITVPGGYNSTDGCGHPVKFKIGVAINARVIGWEEFFKWNQVQTMYDNGWDIFNHSFNHEPDPAHPISSLNQPMSFYDEIEGNSSAIQQHIGFYPRHFVIPSNSQNYLCEFGVTDNCTTQNSHGMLAIYNQYYLWQGPAIGVNNPIDLNYLTLSRGTTPKYQNVTWDIVKENVEGAANASNGNNKIWVNEYTHSIRANGNGVPGISHLGFNYFKQLMDHIENQYGQSGSDRVWVAGLQSVYEYLYVRNNSNITTSVNGNTMTITATFNNPQPDQRNLDLSILVSGNGANINNITVDGGDLTYNPNTGLVNFSFTNQTNNSDLAINCPNNISVTTPDNGTLVNWSDATATTTCPAGNNININQNAGQASGSYFSIGTQTVSYQADDQCGNVASCSFTVTVEQQSTNSSLAITCPDNITVTTSGGGTTVTWDPATATTTCADNNVNIFLSDGQGPGAYFLVGSHVVAYQANDQCGNSETCSFTVLVENQTASNLTITCPQNISVTTTVGTANVTWDAPTANTNCPNSAQTMIIQINGQNNGSSFPTGTHTIEYRAEDICNNIKTCSFTITVIDETTGNTCGELSGYTKLGMFNNHSYYLSNNPNNWSTAKTLSENNGGYLVSINSQDENNFIKSKIAPLQEMVFIGFNDEASEGNIAWASGDAVTLDLSSGNSDNNDYAIMNFWAGTWTMHNSMVYKKFILEMECGSSSTGSIDLTCPASFEVTAEMNTAVATWTTPTPTTTCSVSNTINLIQISGQASGDNFSIGSHTIAYLATDECNNQKTCNFIVTVKQKTGTSMTISCPDDIQTETGVPVSWMEPSISTTCGVPTISIYQVAGPANGSTVDAGTYIVLYEANDFCDNNVSCSFVVTVSTSSTSSCGIITGYDKLGEFENHGYYLSNEPKKWDSAKVEAKNNGGYLTTISTDAENNFIKNNIGNELVFIGFNDKASEGNPEWANGENTSFDLSYGNSDQNDYALMNFWAGTWQMINNRIYKKYVMEKACSGGTETGNLQLSCPDDIAIEITTESASVVWNAPTFNTTCPTSENVTITQVQGYISGDFFNLGSYSLTYNAVDECNNTATCFFSISVSSGGGNQCGNIAGFTKLGDFGGHSYYMSDEPKNWNQADAETKAQGGYLVSISSEEENGFVKSSIGNNMVIIGYTDKDNEGTGIWANGEVVSIDHSFGNDDNKDFAIMNFWAGTWGMHNGQVAKKFVLEMDCNNQARTIPASIKNTNQQDFYPNPANDIIFTKVKINTDEEVKFLIIDLKGQVWKEQNTFLTAGQHTIEMDIRDLPAGSYFLKTYGRNFAQAHNFIKLK